jgi:RNA-splicing ligase RtcB
MCVTEALDNPLLSGLRSRAQDLLGTHGVGNHFTYVVMLTARQRKRREKLPDSMQNRVLYKRGRLLPSGRVRASRL